MSASGLAPTCGLEDVAGFEGEGSDGRIAPRIIECSCYKCRQQEQKKSHGGQSDSSSLVRIALDVKHTLTLRYTGLSSLDNEGIVSNMTG